MAGFRRAGHIYVNPAIDFIQGMSFYTVILDGHQCQPFFESVYNY